MFDYRKKLGLIALVCSIAGLASCGGGAGTDNKKPVLVSCQDPLVLQDDGTCGERRPDYVPPPCDEGQIRVDNVCQVPDKPMPLRTPKFKVDGDGEPILDANGNKILEEAIIFVNIDLPQADKFAAFATYNLHVWQACGNGWGSPATDRNNASWVIPTEWPNGPSVSSVDSPEDEALELGHDPVYGAYFVLPVNESGVCGNFIVKTPGGAAQTNDLSMQVTTDGGLYNGMAWVIVNKSDMRNSQFSTAPICINDDCSLVKPLLGISGFEAHMLDADTILWDREYVSGEGDNAHGLELYRSAAAGMGAGDDGSVTGGQLVATTSVPREMTDQEKSLAPHLSSYFAYDLLESESAVELAKSLLKDELLVVGRYIEIETETEVVLDEEGNPVLDEDGNPVEVEVEVEVERGQGTRVQFALALDSIYGEAAETETLGLTYEGNNLTAAVWVPNAKNVELRIFDRLAGQPLKPVETIQMIQDVDSGVWSATEDKTRLNGKYYRYRVTAYNPFEKRVRRLEVTDPYSLALSEGSKHSLFIDLNDASTKPDGWDDHSVPTVASPEAMSIYEVHVRDFSILDESTAAINRGKYLAFTEEDSAPVNHLKSLVEAGLTHVHFLPTNDSANIIENASQQINLNSFVFQLCNTVTDKTQIFICAGEDKAPNTSTIKEVLESFPADSHKQRDLVAKLAKLDGFNWGYDPYHFNAPEGSYASNPEGVNRVKEMRAMNQALHAMGLRVVMDVVYPHTVAATDEYADSVLDKLVPGYYYRANPATGAIENGTGAGPDTATERKMMAKFVKDSLVGWAQNYKVDGFRFDQSGFMPKSVLVDSLAAVQEVDADTYFYAEAWTPAGGTSDVRVGEDNRATQEALAGTGIGTFNDRIRNALQQMKLFNGTNSEQDRIRAGLAGNLKDFVFVPKSGFETTAESVGAYNLDPQEAINYVEKHDNETFWDWMHRPSALDDDVTLANRVRIHSMTQSVVLLSQGVPFLHMGSDLLRSKSMSPNSYNAGDWFNRVDFTKQSNNWAVGLPPELRDGVTDEHVASVFANVNTKPLAADVEKASAVFNEFLSIASASPLFSLTTAEAVMDRVGFHDGGVAQVNGLIVMSIDDGVGTEEAPRADLDPAYDAVVVVINGTNSAKNATVNTATGFELHAVLQESVDSAVADSSFAEGDEAGTFSVPAYTTAVFVKPQAGAQGEGLSATATTDTLEPPTSDVPAPYGETDIYVRGGVSSAGWDATDVNRMSYDGGGIYSVILDVPAGTNAFKVAAADWSTPNLGALATIVPDEEVTLAQGSNDNVNITIADAGLYRFELNALVSTTAPTLKVVDPDTFQGVPVFLRGTVSATGWGADVGNQLVYEGDSIYALTLDITAGDYVFKVASDDWSTVNLGTATAVTLGDAIAVTQGSNDNLPINIPADGSYRFEVNARNAEAVTVKVYVDDLFEGTPIYARGTVSSTGWGADAVNQLTYQGRGLYTLLLNIATGDYVFKIAETDWANPNLGAPSAIVGVATVLTQGSNDNVAINIPSTGDYLFTLDTTKADAITITVDQE